jgi:hypothetical protein
VNRLAFAMGRQEFIAPDPTTRETVRQTVRSVVPRMHAPAWTMAGLDRASALGAVMGAESVQVRSGG